MASFMNLMGTVCLNINTYHKISKSNEFVEFINLIKEHGFDGYFQNALTVIIKTILYKSHNNINSDILEDTCSEPKKIMQIYIYNLFVDVFTNKSSEAELPPEMILLINSYVESYVNSEHFMCLLDELNDTEKIHDVVTLITVEKIMKIITMLNIGSLFEDNIDSDKIFSLGEFFVNYLNKCVVDNVEYNNDDSDDDSDDKNINDSDDKNNDVDKNEKTNKRNINEATDDIIDDVNKRNKI
jgi:hypothetical protein